MNKKINRLRRANKVRRKIAEKLIPRLSVYKSNNHIYAQLFSSKGDKVLVSYSTVEKDFRSESVKSYSLEAAKIVGKKIGERIFQMGITRVAFDRSGYKYHGKIKALADAARQAGIQF